MDRLCVSYFILFSFFPSHKSTTSTAVATSEVVYSIKPKIDHPRVVKVHRIVCFMSLAGITGVWMSFVMQLTWLF